LGILLHGAAVVVYPEPVARGCLREKVRDLTRDRRPSVLIAGDSRFESAVIPAVLAKQLGLAEEEVMNIAETACEPAAVIAAYREFAGLFAPEPLMVLNVSFFCINDGAREIVGDELLWPLGWDERLELAGPGRALAAFFLPEKAAWNRLSGLWPVTLRRYGEAGFEAVPGEANLRRWSTDARRRRAQALSHWWYSSPKTDGLRRRQLERDLETLAGQVRLTVVLMPYHPAFTESLESTSANRAEREFREAILALSQQLGFDCLSYSVECLQALDPDLLFHDLVHLNRRGAEVFTNVLARDLFRHHPLYAGTSALTRSR